MPFYFTQATIATADNVAANFATNTWSVDADDVTALGLFHTALDTFYQTVDAYISNLARIANGLELTSYARADPTPRAPVLTNFYTLGPVGSAPLPPEVSLCVSFQGPKVSGQPQARRRGRIYLPFMDEANNGVDGRPSSAMVTAIAGAAGTLLAASNAATTWTWEVFSTVSGGNVTITEGWVDNEWDTQRRRGRKATARTTF